MVNTILSFTINSGDTPTVAGVWDAKKNVVFLFKATQVPVQFTAVLPVGGGYLLDTATNIKNYIITNGLTVPTKFTKVFDTL
jgi:hypothetical protein